MKIKYLEIYNYGPFKDKNVIEFPDDDFAVYFIQGTYDGEPSKSNRAGKSSFVECIRYLLFGDVRAKKEVSLIHKGQDQMYVKGIVNLRGVDVTITRGRTSDNKAILEIEGTKEILKSAKEKELQELLGYTCEDFVATNCIKQGDINGFMLLAPAERKKTILGWFNLEKWKVYEDKAKKKFGDLGKDITHLNTIKDTWKAQLLQIKIEDSAELEKGKNHWGKVLLQMDECVSNIKADLKNHVSLEDTKAKIQYHESNIKFINLELTQIYGKVSLLTSNIKTAQDYQRKAQELEKTIGDPAPIKAKLEEIVKLKEPIVSELAVSLNQTLQKEQLYKSLCSFSGVCPIDSRACDKGQRIPDYAKQLDNEIKALKASHAAATEQINRLSAYQSDFKKMLDEVNADAVRLADFKRYDPALHESALATTQQLHISLTQNKEAMEAEIAILSEKLKEDSYSARLQQLKDKEVEREEILENYNANVSAIARNKQNQESVELLNKSIKEAEDKLFLKNQEYYRLMYICSLLNKDGIPSLLIENSISEVEDFANVILDSISPGFKLEFSTFKELTSKETHCSVCGNPFGSDALCQKCRYGKRSNKVKEEIDLKVFTSTLQELEFELDSGGGQVLISLALRLALSKLLSKNFNSNGLLILDEVFASLDEPNRNLVSRLLFNRMKDIMNVNQVFVITHCSLNESSYNRISIKRFDGFSKISLEK